VRLYEDFTMIPWGESGQQHPEAIVRTRDDMDRHDLPYASGRAAPDVRSGLHRTNVAADNNGHISPADLDVAPVKRYIRGFEHSIRRLHCRCKPSGFDESQGDAPIFLSGFLFI
jgi:hypothetical protein